MKYDRWRYITDGNARTPQRFWSSRFYHLDAMSQKEIDQAGNRLLTVKPDTMMARRLDALLSGELEPYPGFAEIATDIPST